MRLLFLIGVLAVHVTLISCRVVLDDDARSAESVDVDPSRTTLPVLPVPARPEQKYKAYRMVARLAKKFSLNFFRKMAQSRVNSEVISPLSFFIPLSMLSYGPQGPARQRFLSAIGLHMNETEIAKLGYKELINQLSRYNIRLRTRIFYAADLLPQPAFVDLAQNVFKSQIDAIPVDDEYINPETFNDWVEEQTNHKCTELFNEPLEIGPKPSIVLVNVVYFKGVLTSPFDRSLTTQRPFHISDEKVVNIPTMHKRARMPYGRIESLHASVVRLDYMSRGMIDPMCMFIILPDAAGEITNVVANVRGLYLKHLFDSEMRDVDLYLPKFKYESSETLGDKLDIVLGAENNPLNAQPRSTNTVESSKSISFGKSVIKYVIEVDEGHNAYTNLTGLLYPQNMDTIVDQNLQSPDAAEVVTFNANHPFVVVMATDGKTSLDIFTMNFNG